MSKRILIVEDEEAIAKMIAMNLRVAGMEPVIFYDGADAESSLATDHSFDLALLDIMVPGRDGFELLEILKPYGIPVIFLLVIKTGCLLQLPALLTDICPKTILFIQILKVNL